MQDHLVWYCAVISSIHGSRGGRVTYSFGPPPGSIDCSSAARTRSAATRSEVAYPEWVADVLTASLHRRDHEGELNSYP